MLKFHVSIENMELCIEENNNLFIDDHSHSSDPISMDFGTSSTLVGDVDDVEV